MDGASVVLALLPRSVHPPHCTTKIQDQEVQYIDGKAVVNFPNISSLVIAEIFGIFCSTQPSQLLVNACAAYASNV